MISVPIAWDTRNTLGLVAATHQGAGAVPTPYWKSMTHDPRHVKVGMWLAAARGRRSRDFESERTGLRGLMAASRRIQVLFTFPKLPTFTDSSVDSDAAM